LRELFQVYAIILLFQISFENSYPSAQSFMIQRIFSQKTTSDIYTHSPKQIEDIQKIRWTHKVNIAPVPEEYRYEFLSALLKQNFQRMIQGAKIGLFIFGIAIFLLDVVNIPMTKLVLREEYIPLRYVLYAILIIGYLAGKRLRLTDPNASMMGFFMWANLFRGSFSLIVYVMFYDLAQAGENIGGAFGIFVGLFSMGLYSNPGYILLLAIINGAVFFGIVIATTTDGVIIFDSLFTGFSMLAIASFSASILYKSFCQEFANKKQTEEEQRKALELNQQLSQANEEISRQMELLGEQSRSIEIANTMLQEQSIEVERERDRATMLLYNILPKTIAERLQSGEENIANHFENVTVLFADIVGFTQLSASRPAWDIVSLLNRIFSAFDIFSEQYNLEKIKTIGDAYMIVGGLPEARDDHAEAVARMALEMLATVELLSKTMGAPISLRIGIHSGAVVAGVIGKKKFAYDLWGDTVNTASRMESHGEAGKIHVSEEVYRALGGHRSLDIGHSSDDNTNVPMTSAPMTNQPMTNGFLFEERGEIEVKGKGMMRTWFLHRSRIEK
jgi:class 3 adenylate cyclase